MGMSSGTIHRARGQCKRVVEPGELGGSKRPIFHLRSGRYRTEVAGRNPSRVDITALCFPAVIPINPLL